MQSWWQRNGKPLLIGGVLALVGVFAWQYWQKYTLEQAQNASVLYQELLNAVLKDGDVDAAQVARLASTLKKEHAGSHYAQYAGLFLVKVAVDAGRLDDAGTELQAIVDAPVDSTLAEIARQRLARILAARNEPQRGLDLLQGETDAAFQGSREELKGDLLLQLGRQDEAYAAYGRAKQMMTPDAALGTLQMKLDDLARNGEHATDA
ncbi:tetratricopeptide repeat protein [Azomonas macrocytogenes]|nr:tetratricopeptide repeat protein [Azomonas macrocytogenes]